MNIHIRLIWCFCLLMLGINVRGQEASFSVQGEIELNEGKLLLLTQRVAGLDTLATSEIQQGKFALSGTLDAPVVALLKVDKYEGGFLFILEPGKEYSASLTKQGTGNIRGGKLQADFLAYQQMVGKANAQLRELKKQMSDAAAQKHYKTASELKAKHEKLQQNTQKKMYAVIQKNKDNVLAAYLQTAGMENVTELAPLKQMYASLSEGAKATEIGKRLAARIAAVEQVGLLAVAPDFTLPDANGNLVSMYSIKGKLKIIDFWASWCGPCRMENPNMVKLYNDFKDKGLVVISVSLDERKAAWQQAVKKDGMPWTHLSSLKGWKCDVVKQYQVDAVPFILVLDENNRILAKQIRAEKLRAFVEEKLR